MPRIDGLSRSAKESGPSGVAPVRVRESDDADMRVSDESLSGSVGVRPLIAEELPGARDTCPTPTTCGREAVESNQLARRLLLSLRRAAPPGTVPRTSSRAAALSR